MEVVNCCAVSGGGVGGVLSMGSGMGDLLRTDLYLLGPFLFLWRSRSLSDKSSISNNSRHMYPSRVCNVVGDWACDGIYCRYAYQKDNGTAFT